MKGRKIKDSAESSNDVFEARLKQTEALIANLLKSSYDFPSGATEKKTFRTSFELAFEFEEMFEVPSRIIALVLHQAECEIINVDGRACWVLYEK